MIQIFDVLLGLAFFKVEVISQWMKWAIVNVFVSIESSFQEPYSK